MLSSIAWGEKPNSLDRAVIDMSIPGQTNERELQALEALAARVPTHGTVVEIGSLFGRSSFALATSVDPSATVYCIDPWVRERWVVDLVETRIPDCPVFSFDAFRQYTAGCPNIVPIRGYSPQDIRSWRKPVDIFFDDSLHHNPHFRRNLRFWFRHMKPGGIMSGHDYGSDWPDVKREVDILSGRLGVPVQVTDAIWWFEVPSRPRRIRRFLDIVWGARA